MSEQQKPRVLIVSRCAWTLWNFREPLLRAARARGYNAQGAGADGDGFREKVERAQFVFHPIPVSMRGMNPFSDLRLLYTLFRLYRRAQPQATHHFTIKPVIWGTIAAWLAGVPRRVATVTGLGYAFTENRGLTRAIAERLYQFALARAHVVFFQNPDDQALFIERGLVARDKTTVVPGSGVDIEKFSPQIVAPPADGRLHFLMIARALRDKGLQEFVDAARVMRARGANARFSLLGGVDVRNPTAISKEQLNAWVAEGVIEWHDAVDDVRPFIAAADVVVLPSYREGLPRVLLEAAAMGKPLLATDVPGCREIARSGENAVLVEVKNVHALVAGFMSFVEMNDESRRGMGRASRRIVEAEYAQAIVIDLALATYELPTRNEAHRPPN